MKYFRKLGIAILNWAAVLSMTTLHAQAKVPDQEDWEFLVGPKSEKYTITIHNIPYPSEMGPIKGTLYKGRVKVGAIIPCSEKQLITFGPPFVFYNEFQVSAACSSSAGSPDGVFYTFRIGDQAWLFSTGIPVTGTSNGVIFNVKNGKEITTFVGRKVREVL